MFAFDDAAAKISEKCPESLADKPKAVRASVTISEVTARSSPEAAARFITPSIPSSISAVFQPAILMYVIPCAASVAENFVLLPSSLAFSLKASKSLPVAPDIAETSLIAESKSAAVLTAAADTPTIGVVTFLVRDVPTDDRLSPKVFILSPT